MGAGRSAQAVGASGARPALGAQPAFMAAHAHLADASVRRVPRGLRNMLGSLPEHSANEEVA
jgi:hypothetical protein